jgi:hypothetical protein
MVYIGLFVYLFIMLLCTRVGLIIKGERTRAEGRMLGGGFRALTGDFRRPYTGMYVYCTFGHDPISKCPTVRWSRIHTYIHTSRHYGTWAGT